MRTTHLHTTFKKRFVNIITALSLVGVGMTVPLQRSAHAACYALQGPQTPGWKRVDLPADAPSLAASGEMPQLRTADPVWLVEPWRFDGVWQTHHHPGRTEYNFSVNPSAHGRFELYFGQPLNGAKVDLWANTDSGTLWLWHEQRVNDNSIEVHWDGPKVHSVVVRVHHHTRHEPPVQRYRLIRQSRAVDEVTLTAPFRQPRSLYFYLQDSVPPALCDAPGRELSAPLELLSQGGTPTTVPAKRQP